MSNHKSGKAKADKKKEACLKSCLSYKLYNKMMALLLLLTQTVTSLIHRHTHVGNVETSEHWRNSSVCAGMCTACALNDYITVTILSVQCHIKTRWESQTINDKNH